MANTDFPKTGARLLLIDISNSFTKLALANDEKLLRVAKLPTPKLDPATFARATRGWDYSSVVISSVVPAREKLLRPALRGVRTVRVTPRAKLGVGIDYPDPNRIGADRLANAAAVVALHGAPAVVIDFGTAVTFDVISPERKYVGGVIAPGLEAMTDYLYQRTALLPRIDLSEPVSAIGKTTRDAMMAGAVFGYRGLVKEIIAEIRRELGVRRLTLVATGGYAELISAGVPQIRKVHLSLTLEGLRIIGTLNR